MPCMEKGRGRVMSDTHYNSGPASLQDESCKKRIAAKVNALVLNCPEDHSNVVGSFPWLKHIPP